MWREEKERKTEVEVDGQCKCGLESDEDGCGGRRRKGRLKRRWMDSVNVDLRVMRMDVEGGEGKED